MEDRDESSKIKYFVNNFYWMFIHMLVTTIFPFLIRSAMIRMWGLEYIGINGLFTSVLQVLNISELGMGSAILYSMYKPMAEHNVQMVNALLNLYRKIYRKLGIGIGLAGLVLLPFLKFLIKGTYPSDVNIYIIYIIQLLNTVIGYVVCYYWIVILQADQKVGIAYELGTIITGIMYILQLFVIFSSRNYYLYIVLLPMTTLILNVVKSRYIQRKYPQFHCEGEVEHAFIAEFYKRVFAMALAKIRTAFRNSIDSIVISAGLGLIALAKYQNYYQLMLVPILLVGIIRGAVLPEFGVSVATEEREKNYHFFEIYSFADNWVSTWCTACLLCLSQNFMCLWVGVENLLSDSVVILLCIYFYIRNVGDNATMLREVTGIWWVGKEGAVIESVLNVVFSILMVRYWGIHGVLIATIVTLVFINLPFEYISIFKEYFRTGMGRYVCRQVIYLINGILICSTTYMICKQFPVGNLRALIMEIAICILLPNLLYIVLNFYRIEFKQLLAMLHRTNVKKKDR